jgi:imidazolonepropionase-like amidohydrolase
MLSMRSRGLVLRGRVRPGGGAPTVTDGVVVLDADGIVAALGPAAAVDPPVDLPAVGGTDAVVMPGVADGHVHLAFADDVAALPALGVVAVRDLGSPAVLTGTPGGPIVASTGPLLTAPGGYPSRTWGASGFARPVSGPAEAAVAVAELVAAGAGLVKLALEPAGGAQVPDAATARAVVDAAHRHGLAVTCHALTVEMVLRALDAGIDELCHTPVEPLPPALVERLVRADIPVVSTLQTFADAGYGEGPPTNARALVAAGVRLAYGTDLGNAGTRPGAEPRELERLVAAGLSRSQALAAATGTAAELAGFAALAGSAGRGLGELRIGSPATAVVLRSDPLVDFASLRRPLAAIVDGRLVHWSGRSDSPNSACSGTAQGGFAAEERS